MANFTFRFPAPNALPEIMSVSLDVARADHEPSENRLGEAKAHR
jgi:hypothetical protein